MGKIRENITVVRAARALAPRGVVGAYVHGALPGHASVGTSAAIVALGTGALSLILFSPLC